jgi:hypothetical protein
MLNESDAGQLSVVLTNRLDAWWLPLRMSSTMGFAPQFKPNCITSQRFDKGFRLFRPVRRASIDDQKIDRVSPTSNRLRNSIKTSAFTPPFSSTMNRMRPFKVIAEIRLMAYA